MHGHGNERYAGSSVQYKAIIGEILKSADVGTPHDSPDATPKTSSIVTEKRHQMLSALLERGIV